MNCFCVMCVSVKQLTEYLVHYLVALTKDRLLAIFTDIDHFLVIVIQLWLLVLTITPSGITNS